MAENTADNKQKRRGRRLKPVEAELEVEEVASDDEDGISRGITAGKGRVTPGRRNVPEEEVTGNVVTRPLIGLRDYFEGVNSELRKVSWPTREEIQRLTVIVLMATILASIVLGLIGLGFTELFRLGLANPVIFLVVFAVVVVVGFLIYRRSRVQDISPY